MDEQVEKVMEQQVREILGDYVNTFWGDRILAAAKRGSFAWKDIELARNWHTCACGRLTQEIKRASIGYPTDPELRLLGVAFFADVAFMGPVGAATTLVAIEKRAKLIGTPKHKGFIARLLGR